MYLSKLLLQIDFNFFQYKAGILCFITAFMAAMICMPPLIYLIKRYKLYDVPDLRKDHSAPIPTMGGIAVCLGMAVACTLWFHFSKDFFTLSFFFSMTTLFAIGIMDDLRDVPAYYKFIIQLGVAMLVTIAGVRITSFNGLLGIYQLPVIAQYLVTVIAIVGITNAFNLIDGIDGLAAGLGFMSLAVLAIFLTLSKDYNEALVAFALAGGLVGFLYYNYNPARIFMGDTGSLVLGFTIAVLSIRLMQFNIGKTTAVISHAPVFALSIVLIPVFDTVRVFALRISNGQSPFNADKTHIHHLLTNNGWSHGFTTKLICTVHGLILILGFFSQYLRQEAGIAMLLSAMLLVILLFRKMKLSAAIDKKLQLD
jgi:UDP-GlcNAc:undecaprenyl-phosphate/decaprenyl-phosphate GlcNAc-1-phosphate transferase